MSHCDSGFLGMRVVKQKKVEVGKVTPQGVVVPSKEDIKAGKIAPRGRNRGRRR